MKKLGRVTEDGLPVLRLCWADKGGDDCRTVLLATRNLHEALHQRLIRTPACQTTRVARGELIGLNTNLQIALQPLRKPGSGRRGAPH